jgi:hypothetical protein
MAVNVDEKHIRLFLGKLGILIIAFLDNKDLFHNPIDCKHGYAYAAMLHTALPQLLMIRLYC